LNFVSLYPNSKCAYMNPRHYVFSQIVKFLPKRYFERLVVKYPDKTGKWSFTHWNHLLVLMFGQLASCRSLRELVDILVAHSHKAYHLGFGVSIVKRSTLSVANTLRDYRIFETFAMHMINIAQAARIDKEFVLHGKYYTFDSSTISLCLKLFPWASFRKGKSGIKIHTQLDMNTQIPVFNFITNAIVHDVNAMELIDYERMGTYVFDRGYWDLERLFKINLLGAFFIIREKGAPTFEVVEGDDLLDGSNNVLKDQTVRFTRKASKEKYPAEIRRIVFYVPELRRSFVYYTNCFHLAAADIALLYKHRWLVELFFKWMKQHLKVKTFWGHSENAVRLQIYAAISTYCAVATLEHNLKLNRSIYEVLRVLGSSLLTKDNVKDLFSHLGDETVAVQSNDEDIEQLELEFE